MCLHKFEDKETQRTKNICFGDNNMKHIEDINILVVGDIMLDEYIYGTVDRISPEAPVPVVKVTGTHFSLGGCGNVVRNIKELGANVTCVAAASNDRYGKILRALLKESGVEARLVDVQTTTRKTRIVGKPNDTQMLRLDDEETDYIESKHVSIDGDYDMIVVSDYAKGMVTADITDRLKSTGIPIIVDPKPKNIWLYDDVFMITPNKKEYDEMCLSDYVHPFTHNIKYILKTLGKDGMELLQDGVMGVSIPLTPINVYNVSGAGDTVVAIMSVCLSMGISVHKSAIVANECARYVVTQPDTSVVPRRMFNTMIASAYYKENA